MTKFFILVSMLTLSLASFAQQYTCPELQQDISTWNTLKQNNNTKWSNDIMDKGMYSQNADGSFEYVYIMHTKDSMDINTLRNISFNYIAYYFNVDNQTRANMEANSPQDGVVFKGKLNRVC